MKYEALLCEGTRHCTIQFRGRVQSRLKNVSHWQWSRGRKK